MTIKKLSAMPYAQAHVEIDGLCNRYLFSYTTLVAKITSDGWLTCYGLYSRTTRRHIGAFMREYVKYPNGEPGSYHDAERCYKNNYRFNVETGEIEFLSEDP